MGQALGMAYGMKRRNRKMASGGCYAEGGMVHPMHEKESDRSRPNSMNALETEHLSRGGMHNPKLAAANSMKRSKLLHKVLDGNRMENLEDEPMHDDEDALMMSEGGIVGDMNEEGLNEHNDTMGHEEFSDDEFSDADLEHEPIENDHGMGYEDEEHEPNAKKLKKSGLLARILHQL